MSTLIARWRASYTAGDWLVLAGPTAMVALDPQAEIAGSQIEQLWSQVLASASMDDVVSALVSLDRSVSPRLLAVFWSADGMRTLVRGSLTLREVRSGNAVAEGEGVVTWREAGLEQISSVVVALPSAGASSGQALPLVAGAVRAGSLRIDAAPESAVRSPQLDELDADPDTEGDAGAEESAEESAEDWDAPTARSDRDSDVDSGPDTAAQVAAAGAELEDAELVAAGMDGVETALMDPPTLLAAATSAAGATAAAPETSEAGPQVEAVFCPSGHANPPGAAGCWVCGQPIQDQRVAAVPRPVLARLRLPDGSTVVLDQPVLIGRAPASENGKRLITVPSPSHDISRTHIRIEPDGWQILVTDLASTNGTTVVTPGPGVHRIQLDASQPLSVALGTLVELGDGVAILIDTVESAALAAEK